MKKQLKLETDRKSAKEGEFIDIRWDCQVCPDSLILTFDSGHKTDKIIVSDRGSTRIAIPNCKGKFRIRLIAGISGKKVTEEIAVRVLNIRTKKQNARSIAGRFKLWGEKIHADWCVFRAQCKYWWLSQKKWKKILWIVLLIIWLGLLVFSFVKAPASAASESQTAYINIEEKASNHVDFRDTKWFLNFLMAVNVGLVFLRGLIPMPQIVRKVSNIYTYVWIMFSLFNHNGYFKTFAYSRVT